MVRANEFEFGQQVTESNIDIVEDKVIKRVSDTISILEIAIEKWENTKIKPKELEPKFEKYKKLRTALCRWGKEALLAKTQRLDFDKRIDILQNFVKIFHTNS